MKRGNNLTEFGERVISVAPKPCVGVLASTGRPAWPPAGLFPRSFTPAAATKAPVALIGALRPPRGRGLYLITNSEPSGEGHPLASDSKPSAAPSCPQPQMPPAVTLDGDGYRARALGAVLPLKAMRLVEELIVTAVRRHFQIPECLDGGPGKRPGMARFGSSGLALEGNGAEGRGRPRQAWLWRRGKAASPPREVPL